MHSDILVTFDDGSTESLSHHGVKGMKWGVRKERPHSNNGSRRGKAPKKIKAVASRVSNSAKQFKYDVKSGWNEGVAEARAQQAMQAVVQQWNMTMAQVQQNNFAMQEAERASRQAASLSMSGGMNPFMFGM